MTTRTLLRAADNHSPFPVGPIAGRDDFVFSASCDFTFHLRDSSICHAAAAPASTVFIFLDPRLDILGRNLRGESRLYAAGALASDPHCGVESVFALCALAASWMGLNPLFIFGYLLLHQSHLIVAEAWLLRDPFGLVGKVTAPVRNENSSIDERSRVYHALEALEMEEAGCEVGAVVLNVVWAEAAGDLVDSDAEVANGETVIIREGAILGTTAEVPGLSGLAAFHFVRVLLDAEHEFVAERVA